MPTQTQPKTNYPDCPECGTTRPCFDCYRDQVEPDTTTEHALGQINHGNLPSERTYHADDTITFHVAAPGIGTVTYRITRIESNGEAYGVLVADNSRELQAWEVA